MKTAAALLALLCFLAALWLALAPVGGEDVSPTPDESSSKEPDLSKNAPDAAFPLRLVWKRDLGESLVPAMGSSMGLAMVGTEDRHIMALSLKTGDAAWTARPGAALTGVSFAGGGWVTSHDDGAVQQRNATTGAPGWSIHAGDNVASAPLPFGGRLVFGSYDSVLRAVDSATGALAWSVRTEQPIHAPPVAFAQTLWIAGCDGVLRGVDSLSGQEAATMRYGEPIAAAPVADPKGDALLLLTLGGKLYRYAPAAESPLSLLADLDRQCFNTPAPLPGDPAGLIVSGRKGTIRLNPGDGAIAWRHPATTLDGATPVVRDDVVYVGDEDGVLWMLDAATGRALARRTLGESVTALHLTPGGLLLAGTGDGLLYAFAAAE